MLYFYIVEFFTVTELFNISFSLQDTDVCGFDGFTYQSRCQAEDAGTGVDYEGDCLPSKYQNGKGSCYKKSIITTQYSAVEHSGSLEKLFELCGVSNYRSILTRVCLERNHLYDLDYFSDYNSSNYT